MQDLISREDFRDRMYHQAFEVDSELQKWDSGCWVRYKLFEKILDEMPTIESRPKGEWVETDLDCGKRHIRCNQCWYADCEIPKEKIKDMDYCPQCGAEMER